MLKRCDGSYSITVPSNQSVLRFSSAGMRYGGSDSWQQIGHYIKLEKDVKVMDDVVVVGYGSKKRVNIQGAVSTIKATEIEDLPVANLSSSLSKQGTGCCVNFSSGKPGSTTTT